MGYHQLQPGDTPLTPPLFTPLTPFAPLPSPRSLARSLPTPHSPLLTCQRAPGNDAFGTGDYGRALHFYAESISVDAISAGQAKTFANTAATLCKLWSKRYNFFFLKLFFYVQ